MELRDPNDKSGNTVMYNVSGWTIPPTDQIYDTHAKKMVDIGTVLSVGSDGRLERVLKFDMKPNKHTGDFYLYGNNEQHQYLYWYFQICNYNRSNKRRFTNKPDLFFEVDEAGEAKKMVAKNNQRLNVERYILQTAGYRDLKMIAESVGLDVPQDEDILRSNVLQYALNDVSKFEVMLTDKKEIESKSVIKRAIDEGIVEWREVERTMVLGGATIATLARVEGKKPHEQLDEYLKTTKNGDKVFENIKKLVAAKDAA